MIINRIDISTLKIIKNSLGVNENNLSYIVFSDDLGQVKKIYSSSKFYSDKFVAMDVLSELKILIEKEFIRVLVNLKNKNKNLRCF